MADVKEPNGSRNSFDEFFNGVNLPDAPANDLTSRMKNFVLDHEAALGEMYKVLGEDIGDSWDAEHDPIGIDVTPIDQEPIISMVTRFEGNPQFNKIVIVFAHLCEEMREMEHLAERRFYGVLAMFGHRDEEDGEDKKHSSSDQADADIAPKIEPEGEMGMFLPFFQDLVNFIERAQAVIQNVICQLACLYHARQKLYMTTFKNVMLLPLFERLGGLCRVLVTMDVIIADNPNIADGWHQYKRMIKYVRSDPKGYGVEEGQLRLFEGLLVRLDRKVLNATIFEDAVSQEFGLPGAVSNVSLVGGNKVLFSEFTEALRRLMKKVGAGYHEGRGMDSLLAARGKLVINGILLGNQATSHRSSKMLAENIAHLIGQTLFQMKRLIAPLRSSAFDDVQYQLWKLDLLSSFQEKLESACSCDCLYWIDSVIPVFFEDIFKNPDQVTRIPYLLAALRDCRRLLLSYDPTPPSTLLEGKKPCSNNDRTIRGNEHGCACCLGV
eukprot:jgi/Bigna1/79807/fgenesh1_pg.65_\